MRESKKCVFRGLKGGMSPPRKAVFFSFPDLYPDYDLKMVRLAESDRIRHFYSGFNVDHIFNLFSIFLGYNTHQKVVKI